MNNLYKGTFNWHGELHTLHTHARCKSKAFGNFCVQLAGLLKVSRRSVYVYFVDEKKDNWKVVIKMRYKERLRALLSGLECQHIEELIERSPEHLKDVGVEIAKYAKIGAASDTHELLIVRKVKGGDLGER